MTIQTKFSLLDEVWFINKDGKAQKSTVNFINYAISQNQQFKTQSTFYKLDASYKDVKSVSQYYLKEDQIYATKEELLKSL